MSIAIDHPPLPTWSASPIIEWLILEGWRIPDPADLLAAMCDRLIAAGVPLLRGFFAVPSLHPEHFGLAWVFRRGQPLERLVGAWAMRDQPEFENSPLQAVAREGAAALRRRLMDPRVEPDYPILVDMKAQGVTDYLALPLAFSNGELSGVSFATDHPQGFTTAALVQLNDLLPVLARILENHSLRSTATNLLDTYLGADVGRRVLNGQVRRGSTETIFAAIWACDLRGFSRLSEALPRESLIQLLNEFFEIMASTVQDHSGQVLKFIGDGLLAIFPVADAGSERDACLQALGAATAAGEALTIANAERLADGKVAIDYGLAMHIGEVTYGNIGGRNRLDFTVIGPAVNVAARLEQLCRTLDRRPLVTAEFARASGAPTESLGRFALYGIGAEQEVHGLLD